MSKARLAMMSAMMQAGSGGSGGGGDDFEPVELPEGYTQIAYLEKATGNGYINTQVLAQNNLLIKCKVMTYDSLSATSGQYGTMFGARYYSGDCVVQLSTYTAANSGNSGNIMFGNSSSLVNAHITPNSIYELDLGLTSYTVNGTSYEITRTDIATAKRRNIYLFALDNNNSALTYGHGRIYYFKMWVGETLVRDFIPCTNSEDAKGLYDLVNNKFYALT